MEKGDILADAARVGAVWRRVTGEAGAPEEPAPAQEGEGGLARFCALEAEDARLYAALASRTGGAAARTLSGLASGSRRRLRELRAACFLETGETFAPAPACAVVPALPGALRQRYGEELRRAEEYRRAAETAESPVSSLLLRLAGENGARAESLLRLCARLL